MAVIPKHGTQMEKLRAWVLIPSCRTLAAHFREHLTDPRISFLNASLSQYSGRGSAILSPESTARGVTCTNRKARIGGRIVLRKTVRDGSFSFGTDAGGTAVGGRDEALPLTVLARLFLAIVCILGLAVLAETAIFGGRRI